MKELLCIKTHSQGVVKAGQVYPMFNTKQSECCGYVIYDVGIKSERYLIRCGGCGSVIPSGQTHWIGSKILIPIGTIDELEQYKQEAEL